MIIYVIKRYLLAKGLIQLVLHVLSTESVVYQTCKNLLSTVSIDSCIVLVKSQFISFAYCYGSVESYNSASRKYFRTKVTPDFYLTYSKNAGNLGSESKSILSDAKRYFSSLKN